MIIKVIGVFPNIKGEDGFEAAGDGVSGTGLLGYVKGAVCGGAKPHPAASEKGATGCGKGLLEFIETPPLLLYPGGKPADGNVTLLRGAELQEIEVVVEDLAGIVEYATRRFLHDILQRKVLPRSARNKGIEVVYIGLQVLSMMETYCGSADYGLQRIGSIRKLN